MLNSGGNKIVPPFDSYNWEIYDPFPSYTATLLLLYMDLRGEGVERDQILDIRIPQQNQISDITWSQKSDIWLKKSDIRYQTPPPKKKKSIIRYHTPPKKIKYQISRWTRSTHPRPIWYSNLEQFIYQLKHSRQCQKPA